MSVYTSSRCSLNKRPHYVYRAFSTDAQLLYVGVTVNPAGRFMQHNRKPWWNLIESSPSSEYKNGPGGAINTVRPRPNHHDQTL